MELFHIALTTPVLPATILLCIMLFWAGMVILGTIDLHHALHIPDPPSLDLPDHVEIVTTTPPVDALPQNSDGFHEAVAAGKVGFTLVAIRWLNLSGVPIIVWSAVFTVTWWAISALNWVILDKRFIENPGSAWTTILVLRNLIMALMATKVITLPIRRAFEHRDENSFPLDLIGKECTISSSEATPEFGLVKYPTGGAPLLLNVRTDGAHIPRGTPVWIIHYDAARRVYIVSPTTTKSLE